MSEYPHCKHCTYPRVVEQRSNGKTVIPDLCPCTLICDGCRDEEFEREVSGWEEHTKLTGERDE